MSGSGTAAYDSRTDLPPLVAQAVLAARGLGFGKSCLPEQGELLRVLARGIGAGVIGETGTGCGVGLAWLADGAARDARLVSVERDPAANAAAARVFAGDPRVELLHGDWRATEVRVTPQWASIVATFWAERPSWAIPARNQLIA